MGLAVKRSFEITINASTINNISDMLIWDETKRESNLRKHGLDFADAVEVLESRYRLDIAAMPAMSYECSRFPMHWVFWRC